MISAGPPSWESNEFFNIIQAFCRLYNVPIDVKLCQTQFDKLTVQNYKPSSVLNFHEAALSASFMSMVSFGANVDQHQTAKNMQPDL